MLRGLAVVLIVAGLIFLLDALQEEGRGVAAAEPIGSSGELQAQRMKGDSEALGMFRELMIYQYVRAGVCLVIGFLLWGFARKRSAVYSSSRKMRHARKLEELEQQVREEFQKQEET